MYEIVSNALSGVGGIAIGLLTPYVRWHVEKRRAQFRARVDLIAEWRGMVHELCRWMDEQRASSSGNARPMYFLERHQDFLSLRGHLSEGFIKQLENGHLIVARHLQDLRLASTRLG
jgi:hypothetical protein